MNNQQETDNEDQDEYEIDKDTQNASNNFVFDFVSMLAKSKVHKVY